MSDRRQRGPIRRPHPSLSGGQPNPLPWRFAPRPESHKRPGRSVEGGGECEGAVACGRAGRRRDGSGAFASAALTGAPGCSGEGADDRDVDGLQRREVRPAPPPDPPAPRGRRERAGGCGSGTCRAFPSASGITPPQRPASPPEAQAET